MASRTQKDVEDRGYDTLRVLLYRLLATRHDTERTTVVAAEVEGIIRCVKEAGL